MQAYVNPHQHRKETSRAWTLTFQKEPLSREWNIIKKKTAYTYFYIYV